MIDTRWWIRPVQNSVIFRSRFARAPFVCLLFVCLLTGCEENRETLALGTLERDLIRLTATEAEIVTAVYVEEGELVEPGQALLQLDETVRKAALDLAQAEAERSRAYLQQLQNGARQEELASARARMDNAAASALESEKNYARIETLVSQKLLGQAELDTALAQRDSAGAALTDAEEQLALLQHGTRQEQIEQAQAQWQAARQQVAIAERHLQNLQVVATRKGRVDSLPWNLGERVVAGAVVAVLVADTNPYVRAYVPESVRAGLYPGQRLTVRVDGVEKSFEGSLTHIQQDPAFTPHFALTELERSRFVYLAEVQLGDDAAQLPSGVPAQVVLSGSDFAGQR